MQQAIRILSEMKWSAVRLENNFQIKPKKRAEIYDYFSAFFCSLNLSIKKVKCFLKIILTI